ncbi:cilia- and flagella-associated protein 46 isoform 2-T2 [Synchiropus picturatus]
MLQISTTKPSKSYTRVLYLCCESDFVRLSFVSSVSVFVLGHLKKKRLSCPKMDLDLELNQTPPANEFLSQAQQNIPSATAGWEEFREPVQCLLKAIEISKKEPRYHYIVFNASVLYLQTVRPLLRPQRNHHLVPSLRQVVRSLEEVGEKDLIWRAELMMYLIECLVGSGKNEGAKTFARTTGDFIKKRTPELFPKFFTLLVHHKLSESGGRTEMSRQYPSCAAILEMQLFKNELRELHEDESPGKLDKNRLDLIFEVLVGCCKSSPASRVTLLLELAWLALRLKHQNVAIKCFKELKSAGDATTGQCILIECASCQIKLLKKGIKMNDLSKSSVAARLKEIGKLDHLLQTAVIEGEAAATQAVCATQWRFCIPLLHHNLRRHVKQSLVRVAKSMEDIQSMLLEVRCQIHLELARIEDEEGHLEAALTHLQKAKELDDGAQEDCLASALRLLQLRAALYETPARTEDKASKLLQQVKDVQENTDIRATLISVGLLLAPEEFHLVLNADNPPEIDPDTSRPAGELSAKAEHHRTGVKEVDGHLARQEAGTDHRERMELWATLAKTARKRKVWDVCRAACRFCLLYDDGRWKMSDADGAKGTRRMMTTLRLLADICCVNAEVTIEKLHAEDVQFNCRPDPRKKKGICITEKDPDWIIYRDWIQSLSTYAIANFLRAAQLGEESQQPWLVANTAVYLWNYSRHLLAAEEYVHLLPTFHTLLDFQKKKDSTGSKTLLVLLCEAVARGLLLSLKETEIIVEQQPPPSDKGKAKAEKGNDKSASVIRGTPSSSAMQDARKAQEMCEFAFRISNCNNKAKTVPIAVRKKVVATWVRLKRLLQQPISSKLDPDDECQNAQVSAMTSVLVGVEMLQCNRNPRHMEFTIPSLATLVNMGSDCKWTDAVVEMNVWCQLAAFCYDAHDHDLVLRCTAKALELKEAAEKSHNNMPLFLYGLPAVNEMLSSSACLQGLSLAHKSYGNVYKYKEALESLLSAVSYSEKAENPALCVSVVKHYWNTCLPLTNTPAERRALKEPLQKILVALTYTFHKHGKKQVKSEPTPPASSDVLNEDELILKMAIYDLLLIIYMDNGDCRGALQMLDKAIRAMPNIKHKIHLLKHRIQLKARLGENVMSDMQSLKEEGNEFSSLMWHRVALRSNNLTQQLYSYQKSLTTLQGEDTSWQKVDLLLEFAQWLYFHNFPKSDAEHLVQWAIDILLHIEKKDSEGGSSYFDRNTKKSSKSSIKCELLEKLPECSFAQSLSSLSDVRRLDRLVQAHTLLAIIAGRTCPNYQHNLLRAYTCVLLIWKISLRVAPELYVELDKSRVPTPPPSVQSKKGKDKSKGKKAKEQPQVEEKPKVLTMDDKLPSTAEDWVKFTCPELARQVFRTNDNPNCLNVHTITKQEQTLFYLRLLEKQLLSLSLNQLTLPVLHLAETIAYDLLDRRGIAHLCRLRILKTCCQLGMETSSPYHKELLNLCRINEQEHMRCQRVIALSRKKRFHLDSTNQVAEINRKIATQQRTMDVSSQDIWLDKAHVCLGMGLHEPARQLLVEAQLVASELGDHIAMARSLLDLASLNCEEGNHAQALLLLEKVEGLSGDEDFWYQFTLTKVRDVVGQRDAEAQTKTDLILKRGCEALRQIIEQQVNQVPKLMFLITSLEMRGAIECVRAVGRCRPGEILCSQDLQMLTDACNTLNECTYSFTKLNYLEDAAKSNKECAYVLSVLASSTIDTEKRKRYLLDALSCLNLAVLEQERVVLNAESLLPPQKEDCGLSLPASRRLVNLRMGLAEFCLLMLENECELLKQKTLDRETMTSAEITLEDFTHETPEPGTLGHEWVRTGSTTGQVALGQLSAVSSCSLNHLETRARCLSLMGKSMLLMAVKEDPLFLSSMWERCVKGRTLSEHTPAAGQISGQDSDASKSDLEMQAKLAKLQQKRIKAEQLLAQARQVLDESITLCLQHKLPASILTDAAVNMLECYGRSKPETTVQYLALFQSGSAVAQMSEILNSVCTDTSVSELSALLSLHRKLLLSHEDRPNSMQARVEDSLKTVSKAFSQVTINPSHLNLLAELPPNINIIILQHSADGSRLYGAVYQKTSPPECVKDTKDAKDAKNAKQAAADTLTCSRVAKVSVCPAALLALLEETRAFGQERRRALLKETCSHTVESRPENHEKELGDQILASRFKGIVQKMEEYLSPIMKMLSDGPDQRLFEKPKEVPVPAPVPVPDASKTKDKEEKISLDLPLADPGRFVVLLADMMLLELPLEALAVLQEDDHLTSVSRDFCLQLLHSRLHTEDVERVESVNKKETKGGKKAKGNQSRTMKEAPASQIPSHTIPVDTQNFKYIFNPHNGCKFEGSALREKMKKLSTSLAEGLTDTKQTQGLSKMVQWMCECSGFIYLGAERLTENILPGKLAALNLSDCRLAVLFDMVQNKGNILQLSNLDVHESAWQRVFDKPLETALLLSLGGVRSVVVNQWHSSLEQSVHYMTSILESFLRLKQTSGQSVHDLRKGDSRKVKNAEVPLCGTEEDNLAPAAFNCVLYGLPSLIATS